MKRATKLNEENMISIPVNPSGKCWKKVEKKHPYGVFYGWNRG